MLREGRHDNTATDDPAPRLADADPQRDPTTFSHGGAIPPVAQDGDPSKAPPTASERAYGHNTLPGLGYVGSIGLGNTPPIGPTIQKTTLNVAAARSDAEQLLTSKGMDASASAKQALELLVDLPDGDRGSVIDSLAPKAFDNLIDRISESDRERFYKLVDVSKNPELTRRKRPTTSSATRVISAARSRRRKRKTTTPARSPRSSTTRQKRSSKRSCRRTNCATAGATFAARKPPPQLATRSTPRCRRSKDMRRKKRSFYRSMK